MISYEEALEIITKSNKMESATLPVREAYTYVAAKDVDSNVMVPPFNNSAMDGFAVRAEDIKEASEENPITLKLAGSTVAGDTPSAGEGGAWEIMTGAAVPEGYDAVVRIEDVNVNGTEVVFTIPAAVKDNIRDAGEDFMPGDKVIKEGTIITPHHVKALITVGQRNIDVYKKPEITIFSTGKELVEDLQDELLPGQIRNSNGPYIVTALKELGLQGSYGGVIADEPDVFEAKIKEALEASDIIISTGAVSAGKHDFIPDSLKKLGAEILFHKVAIRPGKPVLYAKFPDGTHYFGLPGNPVSAAIGLRFFVVPLLYHMQGMKSEGAVTARLLMPSPKKKGLRFFKKAHVSVAYGGKLHLDILKGQESFKIHPLLQANCWASFTEDQSGNEVGESIEVYPLLPDRWTFAA